MKLRKNNFIAENIIAILFGIICVATYLVSKLSFSFVLSEVLIRISRNFILILSLIIPVIAGIGLNFGVVLGAMAAQISLVFITHWRMGGLSGILFAYIVATVIAVVCGWLLGKLFNRTKGQEMITGLIVGFFADGLYQFLFLVLIGTVIKINDPEVIVEVTGTIKDTIKLQDSLIGVLDKIWKISFSDFLPWLAAAVTAACAVRLFLEIRSRKKDEKTLKIIIRNVIPAAVTAVIFVLFRTDRKMIAAAAWSDIFMVPMIFGFAIAVLLNLLLKTKLGQNLRAIGQDMGVAAASGIDVNKTRITATIISTVLASWGVLISLQNLGSFSTYLNHESIGTLAVATLLLGGGSNKKATVSNVLIGLVIFHTLFVTAPAASNRLLGDPNIGENFRTFMTYFAIAMSLVLHTIQKSRLAARQQFEE